jgi:hypothetical protein
MVLIPVTFGIVDLNLLLKALGVEIINCHENSTCLSGFFTFDLGILIFLSQELSSFIFNNFKLSLHISVLIVNG